MTLKSDAQKQPPTQVQPGGTTALRWSSAGGEFRFSRTPRVPGTDLCTAIACERASVTVSSGGSMPDERKGRGGLVQGSRRDLT